MRKIHRYVLTQVTAHPKVAGATYKKVIAVFETKRKVSDKVARTKAQQIEKQFGRDTDTFAPGVEVEHTHVPVSAYEGD